MRGKLDTEFFIFMFRVLWRDAYSKTEDDQNKRRNGVGLLVRGIPKSLEREF
jgi:hypothetical protein